MPMCKKLRIEQLEQRSMMAVAAVEWQGVGYFADAALPSLQRYDINQQIWLSPIRLIGASSPPTAFATDSDGIYAAFDKSVYRYDQAGGSRQHLFNASAPVIGIHSDANLLFVNYSESLYANVTSLNKTNNTIVDTMRSYIDAIGGSSIAPSKNRIFGRSIGISPADLTYVDYSDTGTLLENGDSSYHGDFDSASKTWTFDNDRYVVDNSGHLYTSDTLLHSGRLGTNITDIDFSGGTIPIVLNGKKLTSYSTGFLPTGTLELANPGEEIFVNSRNVLVFRQSSGAAQGYSVEVVGLDRLGTPPPGDTVNPIGLVYSPSDVYVAKDGTVLLYDMEHQSVFRWDPVRETYSQSIRLLGTPLHVAYSNQFNVLYTSYQDGLIRKIDLNAAQPFETPFHQLPGTPLGLVTADPYLLAEDSSGAWSTLNSISSTGQLVDKKEWHYPSSGLIWDGKNESIYYFSMFSPSDLHSRKINVTGDDTSIVRGGIGLDRDTPLHGSPLIQLPVRITPDGQSAVLGSGAVFNAKTLQVANNALGNTVSDITWLGNELFSARNIAGVSQVQRWLGATYSLEGVRQFEGSAVRLLSVRPNVLLLITLSSGEGPRFQLLNSSLETVNIESMPPATPQIVWSPPSELLALAPLDASYLSATVDAPGVLTYTPSPGSYLTPGVQTLTVTFTPDDAKRYRPATKSLTIQVWGVDFGDAMSVSASTPSQGYPATIADNGARHILKDALRLGSSVDAERDGVPADSDAKGDNAIGKDEDGVRFPSTILSLTDSSASSLSAVASGDGYLTAWIDFNGDGDWSDPSEYVVQNEWVTTGAHVFSFEVPPNAIVGKVAARVRLSSQSGLAPTGIASNGEVEDYVLEIRNSHESIDITPVGGGTVSIVDFSATHIQYVEDGKVLARYPKSIWKIRTARFPGSESDDTMDLDSQTQGELFLLGNAGAGNDRVHFKKGQNLDLTKRIQDSVTNLEMIDMKNDGVNLLRLDAESASAVTDGLHSLKIYADATDQVFFRGEWKVDSKVEINGEQFHQLTSGTVSVNLANGRMRQNPLKPLDVDLDGSATPLDVLSIINKLNIADLPVPNGTNYLDVDGDGMISPLDVLTLINALNDRSGPGGEGEAKETVSDAFPMAFAADFEWEWNRKKRS